MKKNLFVKISVILLLLAMVFSAFATTALAVEETAAFAASASHKESSPLKGRSYTQNLAEVNKKLEKLDKSWIKKLEDDKSLEKALGDGTLFIIQLIKDPDNINGKNVGIDVAIAALNIAAVFIPGGFAIKAVAGPIMELFKDKEPSEIEQLQEHIDEQFAIVLQELSEIRASIDSLSDDLDAAVAEVIDAMKEANEAQTAGERVYSFVGSGEGNFDYTAFKNYIFNTDDADNPLSAYAYNDKLRLAIAENASDETIEKCYNDLYRALTTVGNERMPYYEILRQYIIEHGFFDSIQHSYYDWLAYNRATLEAVGKNAEWEAILFTFDVYQTMLAAEERLIACDNYFLSKIALAYHGDPPSDAAYSYISPDGKITYLQYRDLKKQIENLSNTARDEELELQILKDICYILNVENSYTVKKAHSGFFTVDNDGDAFGQVRSGDTVFMNRLTDELCELFAWDPQDFRYVWSTGEENTGCMTITGEVKSLTATLYYKDSAIYTTTFTVDTENAFSGGSGTEEAPYLISEPSQLSLLVTGEDGDDMFYRLACDLDFEGISFSPIGSLNNGFYGTLDGNGYAIKNLTITLKQSTGLFAKIATRGTVKNLVLSHCKILGGIDTAVEAWCGAIAGKNEGTIENCHLKNSEINFSVNSTGHNGQHLNTYVGGIVGVSCDKYSSIRNCSITSSKIRGYAYKHYWEKNNEYNENYLYVGGIAAHMPEGMILNCIVEGNGSIYAEAQSQDNYGNRNAHVYAKAFGITDSDNVRQVYVSSSVRVDSVARSVDRNGKHHNEHLHPDKNQSAPGYTMPAREEIVLPVQRGEYEATYNL